MRVIYILLVATLLTSSCKDVLLESPKAVVAENFYNTAAELEAGVNGIFYPIRQYNAFGFLYPCQLESYSDFSQGRGSYAPISQFQGLDNTNITRVGQMWDLFYQGIRNANIVISAINNGNTAASDADKNKYLGEARFMRAFIYFTIVKNWGKAVLRTEENMVEQNVPLSSGADVYALIESDLAFAEQNLPETASVAGRPTRGAAKAVLTDAYMFQEKYAPALAKANEIVSSGTYDLVRVSTSDDFQNLYGASVVTTDEEIFYIKYSRLSGGGASWDYVGFLQHPASGYYNSSGLYGIYLDTVQYTVYSKWDNRDLRKGLWYGMGDFGLGPNALLTLKFIDGMATSTAAGNDYPFYRYADILLLQAEAEWRVNGITTSGIESLNKVRRRGYGYDPDAASPIDYQVSDFPTSESFLDTVVKERGYETFLEGGKRWLDLKRTGKAKQVIKENTGKDIVDKHFLWPFPISETNINEAIDLTNDQNPGY